MVASVKSFVKNTVISNALFVIYLAAMCLAPTLLIVLAYTLKAFAALTGKELRFVKTSKDIPSCDESWMAKLSTVKIALVTHKEE
jgi:hypothetical protein